MANNEPNFTFGTQAAPPASDESKTTGTSGRGLGSAKTGATGNGDTNAKLGVTDATPANAPKAQVAGIGKSGTLGAAGEGNTLTAPNLASVYRSALPGAAPTAGGEWQGFGYYCVRKTDITGWETIAGKLGDALDDENSAIAKDLKTGNGVLGYALGIPVITGDPRLDNQGPVLLEIPAGTNVAEAIENETAAEKA